MKILFLPKEFPHAKVVGGPIIVYNRIKYLSRKHEVHLLSFIREEERKFISSLERWCKRIELLPYPKRVGGLRHVFSFFFSSIPNYMLNTYSQEFKEKVVDLAIEEKYDCIIAEYSVMGQYLYRNRRLPKDTVKIISVHECYTTARYKVFQMRKFSYEGLKALFYYLKLRWYEPRMYAAADKVLTLTEEGKKELLRYSSRLDIDVVPHGVDVDYFLPENRKPVGNSIIFLGNYRHEPNVDGVLFFYQHIYPRIRKMVPDVKFYIVGQDPPAEIRKLSRDSQVVVTGFVPDVRPYLYLGKVFVVFVRLGGGFRGKALEALAAGLPLVSNSLGAQGIGGRDGEDLLIADQAKEFAERVVCLLRDEKLAKKLSINGRKLVVQKFSWQKGVERLDGILIESVLEKIFEKGREKK